MAIVTSNGQISFLSAYSIATQTLVGGISLNALERMYMDGTSSQTSYVAATANPALTNAWMPNQTQIVGGPPVPAKSWIYSGPSGSQPWQPAKLSEFRSAYNQIPLIQVVNVQTGFPISTYPTTPTAGYSLITLSGYHSDATAVGTLTGYWFYARSIGAGNADAGVGSAWGSWVRSTDVAGINTIQYGVRDGGNRNIQSTSRFYVQDLSGCGSSFDIYVDISYP